MANKQEVLKILKQRRESKAQEQAQNQPGLLEKASNTVNQAYESFKQAPVIKQFGQAVGGAVGAAGGVIGGAVGGAGQAIVNVAQGKNITEGVVESAKRTAKDTATFGYEVGSEAAPEALLGRVPQAIIAAPQIYEGAKDIKEGNYLEGGIKVGTGAAAVMGARGKGAMGTKGVIVPKEVSDLVSQGGQRIRSSIGGKVREESVDAMDTKAKAVSKVPEKQLSPVEFIQKRNADRKMKSEDINRMILSDRPNSQTAKFLMEGGKRINDKVAKNAINQGIPEGSVAVVKGMNRSTAQRALDMLDIREKGKLDDVFGAKNRATTVIGKSFNERAKVVFSKNREAASKLDEAAKSLQGKKLDFNKPSVGFLDELQRADVDITPEGKLDFSSSEFEGIGKAEKLLQRAYDRLVRIQNNRDGLLAHKTKRFLDNQLVYDKEVGGLEGNAERIVKKLRNSIDTVLDESSELYNKVNMDYRNTKQFIDGAKKLIDKNYSPDDPVSVEKAGDIMRTLLSRNRKRPEISALLDSAEDLAKQYGKEFDDDIYSQAIVYDLFESLFGTEAKTGHAGSVAKGVKEGLDTAEKVTSIGGSLKSGNIAGAAIQTGKYVYDKVMGISDEAQIRALRELLERQLKETKGGLG